MAVAREWKIIGGCSRWKGWPDEATFARAFEGFGASGLAERAQAALVKETLSDRLIGHISRDGTAIESREKPARKEKEPEVPEQLPKKRGRPKKGEIREAKPGKLEQQRGKTLAQLLAGLPRCCDRGTKSNAQRYTNSWNGYTLHIAPHDSGPPRTAPLTPPANHPAQHPCTPAFLPPNYTFPLSSHSTSPHPPFLTPKVSRFTLHMITLYGVHIGIKY